MERLRGHQHHVIGDVDGVGDRPLAGGHQPGLEPERGGADGDVGEQPGGEARAELRHLHRDGGVVAHVAVTGRLRVLLPRRRRESRTGDRVDLAGDAVDAEAVAPVRGHLDLQHRLAQRQHLAQRRAGGKLGVELDDALVVVGDLQLVSG